jgi:uncharacterized membrane protein
MFKKISIFLLLVACLLSRGSIAFAQDQGGQAYSTGTVLRVIEQTEYTHQDEKSFVQKLEIEDDVSGATTTTVVGSETIPLAPEQLYSVGQKIVIVNERPAVDIQTTHIADQYRIPPMIALLASFVILVLLVARLKGLTALIGMLLSLAVLFYYMVPQILAGANPVLVSIITAAIISSLIIYIGHGFGYRSHIALFSMLTTLAVVAVLSSVVIKLAYLTGLGDETATYLQFPGVKSINLQGLLLGGIILAALSVLDDSIISQVSVIYQLKAVKPNISFQELWRRGMEVGQDHISTLVNTLILAYAGASLPLFILLSVNNTSQPIWVALNSQTIAEEVVRTLTGSIGLVLSIPLTTLVAAYVVHRRSKK